MTAQMTSAAFLPASHPAALPHPNLPHPALPRHDATDLTGGGSLALITLNDQVYALRITRQGKLILTK